MVSDLLSSTEGSGGISATAPLATYTDKFNELFPYYLSIGMTEAQYWDGDCNLVLYYRRAEALRIDRKNQELWLQGAYIYDALCRVSPILHAFAKKGTKPSPYMTEPFALSEKQRNVYKTDRERKAYLKNKERMRAFMAATNEKMKRK